MPVANEEELDTYRKVGKLTSEIREEVRRYVEPGRKILSIAEKVEDLIREKRARPAFPCNVSINDIAAHYSPPADDEIKVKEGDLVKVDIGSHINGYIGDTATTIATDGDGREIVEAIEKVLERAVKAVGPGIGIGKIGEVIEKTAKEAGFKPVSNLTGHTIDRWALHAGTSIPNVAEESEIELREGEVVALEPFITDGAGEVEDQPEVQIFRLIEGDQPLGRIAKQGHRLIKREYGKLPFAERWLSHHMSKTRLGITLRDLLTSGFLHPYYVLKEKEGGLVAQAEHTVIVKEEGCEVITS